MILLIIDKAFYPMIQTAYKFQITSEKMRIYFKEILISQNSVIFPSFLIIFSFVILFIVFFGTNQFM